MKRRRISPVLLAGLLAVLSGLALFALISGGSLQRDINPTDHWYTVDSIARGRLTQTAESRETDQAAMGTAEVTDQPSAETATPGL